MPSASRAQRGAVLVEFALSSLIIFTALFGTLQLGVIGLEQIKADGAAFTGAHSSAVYSGSGMLPTTLVQSTYPGVNAGQITFVPKPLPSSGISGNSFKAEPVDYGLTQAGAQNSRHGGFSLIVPTQLMATVVRPMVDNLVLGITGSAFTLSGMAVEPQFQELGVHGDVNGDTLNSSAMFTDRVDYFSQGENTPPYFTGFKYSNYCKNLSVNPCAGSFIEYNAFGLAEYLDVDNWSRPTNGVAAGAVFQATLMHQQVFATIASDLAGISGGEMAPGAQAALTTLATYLNPSNGDPKIHCMYNVWDNQSSGGYAVAGTQIGDFPLRPDVPCL